MSDLPEKPKMTLGDLLAAMQQFDQSIAVDFDPTEVVGDLKDKVDAIKMVIDRLEFQALWCKQQAEPFRRAQAVLAANAERLERYVVYQMQQGQFAELPGNAWRAQLQNNAPTLDMIQQECTALDFQRFPNYVKQVRYYEWDTKAIKDALVSKREDLVAEAESQGLALLTSRTFESESIPFAKLTIKQQVRFWPHPPKGKK